MLFTIIIPVYNVEEFLPQCIESILKQTAVNLEVLLINDGSTDNSGIICSEYSEKYQRINVIHKENGGVSEARNKGIEDAKGDYIMFLDADDYWEVDILSKLQRLIEENDKPDLLFTHSEFHEVRNKLKLIKRSFSLNDSNLINSESFLQSLLTGTKENLFSVWRGVYKKEIIMENNILFEVDITIGEDADWLFNFILHSQKIKMSSVAYYVYRINRDGSAMSHKSKKALDSFLAVVSKWIDYYNADMSSLNKIIATKLSDNYIENFKYIYPYDKAFRQLLIKKIENIGLLNFVSSNESLIIKKQIEKIGFEKTLKKLNYKFKRERMLKDKVLKIINALNT